MSNSTEGSPEEAAIISNPAEGSPEEGAASPEVSTELKAMVKSGNAVLSNPKSVGFGIQQIKLENWDPEDEEYWKVSNVACGGVHSILYSPLIEPFPFLNCRQKENTLPQETSLPVFQICCVHLEFGLCGR